MRVGGLILGSVVLGAVGTLVYRNTSEENKKKVLDAVKRFVNWIPENVKGYIPESLLTKLSGEESGSRVTGDVSRSAGPQGHTGGNQGGLQGSR
jgi:hypothetical protein